MVGSQDRELDEADHDGFDARFISVDALCFKVGLATVYVFDFLLDSAGGGHAFRTVGVCLQAVCIPAMIMLLSCKSCSARAC